MSDEKVVTISSKVVAIDGGSVDSEMGNLSERTINHLREVMSLAENNELESIAFVAIRKSGFTRRTAQTVENGSDYKLIGGIEALKKMVLDWTAPVIEHDND